MMKQFDYKLAYEFLAESAWKGLELDVHALIQRVCVTAANVSQHPETLDTEWPVDEDGNQALRAAFSVIPADQLAKAARAVYCAGHWASEEDEGLKLQTHGAYWKFSSYCDQVLRERLGLPPRGNKYAHGCHIELHEGFLRLCVSTPYSWEFHEIGPAVPVLRQSMLEMMPPVPVGGRKGWEDFSAACRRAAMTVRLGFRATPDFLDLERFMTEEKA